MFERFREDIEMIKRRDPATTTTFDAILNSTGMRAVWAYRRHNWLWRNGFKGLARYLSTRSRRRFAIEIHPGATIGRRFMIDHGAGIVIGETTIIGDDCLIYQGVTLGGTGKETGKRHPTLGDEVIVGVGASVLGNITLGDRSKVGGGAVVVKDVPPDTTVIGVPGHVVTREGQRIHTEPPVVPAPEVKADQVSPELIARYEYLQRRVYLPDPLDASIEELEERIAALEKRCKDLSGCVEYAQQIQDDHYNKMQDTESHKETSGENA